MCIADRMLGSDRDDRYANHGLGEALLEVLTQDMDRGTSVDGIVDQQYRASRRDLCIDRDIGLTLGQLAMAAPLAYPALGDTQKVAHPQGQLTQDSTQEASLLLLGRRSRDTHLGIRDIGKVGQHQPSHLRTTTLDADDERRTASRRMNPERELMCGIGQQRWM